MGLQNLDPPFLSDLIKAHVRCHTQHNVRVGILFRHETGAQLAKSALVQFENLRDLGKEPLLARMIVPVRQRDIEKAFHQVFKDRGTGRKHPANSSGISIESRYILTCQVEYTGRRRLVLRSYMKNLTKSGHLVAGDAAIRLRHFRPQRNNGDGEGDGTLGRAAQAVEYDAEPLTGGERSDNRCYSGPDRHVVLIQAITATVAQKSEILDNADQPTLHTLPAKPLWGMLASIISSCRRDSLRETDTGALGSGSRQTCRPGLEFTINNAILKDQANTRRQPIMLLRAIDRFFSHDATGGVILMLSAAAALIFANSGLQPLYSEALGATLSITIEGTGLQKPLILWINDGLMAVFFFLVGLELKRELLEGNLKNPRDIVLPGTAAIGGMAVPALVFLSLNAGTDAATGWAIPAATDIAFALGVLALAASRVPPSLKVFLLTLAILDDLGAILIIALFYTAELKLTYLGLALLPLAAMLWRVRLGAHRMAPTLLLGAVLWTLMLKSGVHATLAGVITAFCIPLTDRRGKSPLHSLEDALSPYVLYFIVPVFAFANAGVILEGLALSDLFAPLPLGIAAGLVVGKQVGVFGVTLLAVRLGISAMPKGANWAQIYGISCLAGIGFTMSLFIGSLSYDDQAMMNAVRLGVLTGSAISAMLGYAALMLAPPSGARTETAKG